MSYNKKTILLSLGIILSFAHLSVYAQSEQSKSIPQQCQKFFKETDNLIEEAYKQPGTHTQLGHIQSKLKQSKQQILKMELAIQMNICEKGLAKLSAINTD